MCLHLGPNVSPIPKRGFLVYCTFGKIFSQSFSLIVMPTTLYLVLCMTAVVKSRSMFSVCLTNERFEYERLNKITDHICSLCTRNILKSTVITIVHGLHSLAILLIEIGKSISIGYESFIFPLHNVHT